MRKIAPGVFTEDKYPAVLLGAIVTEEGLMLIDCPLKVEDARAWVASLGEYGKSRYMTLLDTHPDRVLGARGLNIRLIGHDWTRRSMSAWSDTYKGNANPIGAEADGLKRVTGVRRAVPELTFSKKMDVYLGEREIHFIHRPGPTAGSIWVVLPQVKVVFIGDTVTVTEPPYLGQADVEAWLAALDDLRSSEFKGYKMVSAQDGLVKRDDINDMARFLRKVAHRIQSLADYEQPVEAVEKMVPQLAKSYKKIPAARREQVLLRLQAGMVRLCSRSYPPENA